jgi:RNA polymerase sigma factor (sigma-70 family)
MWIDAPEPGFLSACARLRAAEDTISEELLDLVKRCIDGDGDAWRTLLPPFQEIGRRALRGFRLPAADAEDVLAEALTALYSGGLAQFRGETVAELIGFLKAVVRHRALDRLKRQRRWTSSDAASQRHAAVDPSDVAASVADDECVEFLRQAVQNLARSERELYLMKAQGLKEREIAAQTGRPPGTVASQIARLLERLRSALRERGCL